MILHTWLDSSPLFFSIKVPSISSQSTFNELDLSYNFSQTPSFHDLSKMQLFGYISAVFLDAIVLRLHPHPRPRLLSHKEHTALVAATEGALTVCLTPTTITVAPASKKVK